MCLQCICVAAEISVNQVSMNQTYSYGMSWISPSYIVTKQKEECCVCEPVVNADCEVRENDEEIMAIEPEDSLLTQVFELGASLEAKWLLEHYGYDTNRTWAIQRVGFPWKEKKPRAINSLILKLERNKVNVYGTSFFIGNRSGRTVLSYSCGNSFLETDGKEGVVFSHPSSGLEYVLKIREYDKQELKQEAFDSENMEYPTHFHAMTYTIYPELDNFYIADCKQGDVARIKREHSDGPIGIGAVGVLGLPRKEDRGKYVHTDGSIAKTRVACSSVYFDPIAEVEWKIVFQEKQMPDIEVKLL